VLRGFSRFFTAFRVSKATSANMADFFLAKYCIQWDEAGRILRHQIRNQALFHKRRLFAQIH
jgi:hypothetical protein